jgi:hypothetical protein
MSTACCCPAELIVGCSNPVAVGAAPCVRATAAATAAAAGACNPWAHRCSAEWVPQVTVASIGDPALSSSPAPQCWGGAHGAARVMHTHCRGSDTQWGRAAPGTLVPWAARRRSAGRQTHTRPRDWLTRSEPQAKPQAQLSPSWPRLVPREGPCAQRVPSTEVNKQAGQPPPLWRPHNVCSTGQGARCGRVTSKTRSRNGDDGTSSRRRAR